MSDLRSVIRELHHAQIDLTHDAFPGYAATWQDDIRHAAEHIARAHVAVDALIASWGPSQERRKRHGIPGDRTRRDDP